MHRIAIQLDTNDAHVLERRGGIIVSPSDVRRLARSPHCARDRARREDARVNFEEHRREKSQNRQEMEYAQHFG